VSGAPYDEDVVTRELERYQAALRTRGFYEARAVHTVEFRARRYCCGSNHRRSRSHVVVAFAGDQLPESDRERLVPVRTEGSADEDLLEDSNFAIEEYLRARGYRNANSQYTRVHEGRRADHHLCRQTRTAVCRGRCADCREHGAGDRGPAAAAAAQAGRAVRAECA
jgi:hypothetical protein